MFEQDYIMKRIRMLVELVAKIVFNKEMPEHDIVRDEKGNITETSFLCLTLRELADKGEIGKAEDLLFAKIEEEKDVKYLEAGIDFYSYINEKEDSFLELNDFSKEEIHEGVLDLYKIYGLEGLDIV